MTNDGVTVGRGSNERTKQLFGFDSGFLQQLERLTLLNRRPLAGTSAGPRRSTRRGASVEFADFRDYAPGDDFRRIDWNAYARLDRLFLRLYTAEEMTTLTLFLDHSGSMRFGEKALTASRLSAVLAYVALHNYDRVAVAGWGESLDRYIPPRSGKNRVHEVWQSIADLMEAPSGKTDVTSLRRFGPFRRGPGLSIVLTDLLSETDWRSGLRSLRAAGQEVSLLQILAPEEIDPELRGDWKLCDTETGAEIEVTASPRLLQRYREELIAYTQEITDFCRREGVAYARISSDSSLTDTVLTGLRAVGVVA